MIEPASPQLVQEAVELGSIVTVQLADGRNLTGQLRDHPTEPHSYTVHTGRRGRPAVFHEDDVLGVIFE